MKDRNTDDSLSLCIAMLTGLLFAFLLCIIYGCGRKQPQYVGAMAWYDRVEREYHLVCPYDPRKGIVHTYKKIKMNPVQ